MIGREPPQGGSFLAAGARRARLPSEGKAEKGRALETETPRRVGALGDPDSEPGRDRAGSGRPEGVKWRGVEGKSVVRAGDAERLAKAARA